MHSEDWGVIRTIDVHAAGEPLRVIVEGIPEIPGETMLAKRRFAQEHLDVLRRRLMWEPRGHADMYGAILTAPTSPGADIGVLFLHNEGFSTMCGHGIIGMMKVILETGIVKAGEGEAEVGIDTPAGLVVARARREGGVVRRTSFVNVPSFVYERGVRADVDGIGGVVCDVAFGGAYYAYCAAGDVRVPLTPAAHDQLVATGRRVKRAVDAVLTIRDPLDPDLGFLYGVIFVGPPERAANHSRHVCIFAEGELDRSPTGTGVSARAALLHDSGDLGAGEEIMIESILGTCFGVRVVGEAEVGGFRAIVPEVSGEAFATGRSEFVVEPGDPLGDGFIFR